MGFSVNRRNSLRSPACAGKSLRQACGSAPSKDHPRVCGEKCVSRVPRSFSVGSPPRVRGKVDIEHRKPHPHGITPACAGKSMADSRGCRRPRDHPRVCGEKLISNTGSRIPMGSPPRVRGKVWRTVAAAGDPGITPACAGKRGRGRAARERRGDHPRVCGEKVKRDGGAAAPPGSPPRVRGKGADLDPARQAAGITPACAGKSWPCAARRRWCRDHPRVCGEK